MIVSYQVAVATVLLLDRSGGCGTWPMSVALERRGRRNLCYDAEDVAQAAAIDFLDMAEKGRLTDAKGLSGLLNALVAHKAADFFRTATRKKRGGGNVFLATDLS